MDLIRVVLAEGDSWTSGDIINPDIVKDLKGNVNDKLNDSYRLPKVWPYKLGTKLNIEVINEAIAGSSNDGIIRRTINKVTELLNVYKKEEIHVIIGLTSPERKDFYHKKDNDYGWDVLYPLDSSEITEERKLFKKVYSSIYWNKEEYFSRYLQSVFLLHNFFRSKGIEHTFFNAFYQDNDGNFKYDLNKSLELFEAKTSNNYLKSIGIKTLLTEYKKIVKSNFCNTSFKSYIEYNAKDIYDGIHPNEKGHELWANYLHTYLKNKDKICGHDLINLARLDVPDEDIKDWYKDIPEINELDPRGYPMMRPLFSQTNLNITMGVEPKNTDDISDDEEFYYFTMLHHDIVLVARNLRKLPLKVVKALRDNKCKLILDDSLEGRPIYKFLDEIYYKATNMEIPKSNIYYITNNLFAEKQHREWKNNNNFYKEHINVISYMYNVVDIQRLKNPNTHIHTQANLPEYIDIEKEIEYKAENINNIKAFLKVNRTGRPERNLFMLYVNKHNLYNKFKISFPNYQEEGYDTFTKDKFKSLLHEDNIKSLKEKTPFNIDNTDATNHGPPGVGEGKFDADLPFHPKHYRDTFISVVFCAFPFDKACHLHSSTFNPIYCGHPIIQFGPKGSLAELRNRGFKTFNKWWDESYDDIANDWDRFKAVCSIVNLLSTKSQEELLEMYKDMKEVLQYNSNLIYNYDIPNNLTNKVLYHAKQEPKELI